jgi:hypothetical protein
VVLFLRKYRSNYTSYGNRNGIVQNRENFHFPTMPTGGKIVVADHIYRGRFLFAKQKL